MEIIQKVDLNLSFRGIPPKLYMVQGDSNTRIIQAQLWDGANTYTIPTGSAVMMRFRKPDGTGGLYDKTEGGQRVTVSGSTVTVPVATQMLTVAGVVMAEVDIYAAGEDAASAQNLASFAFMVEVAPSVYPDAEIISSDYYSVLTAEIASVLAASTNPPQIGEDGNWYIWDQVKGEYVDSGISAKPEEVPLATYEVPGKVMPSQDFDIAADGTLSLYKAMAVKSVTTNKAAAYEIGTEVEGLELSWALNKSPATMSIQAGATLLSNLPVNARSTTELDGDSRTLWTQLTATISQDMQFAVKATDARGVESSKNTAIRFLRYAYSKVGAPDAAPTTASECVKQADLATFGKNGADFTYTVGSCIWLLTTNYAAKIQTNVLGQWADVDTYGGEAVEFTQSNGITATYYAYRTDTFTGAGTAKYRIV